MELFVYLGRMPIMRDIDNIFAYELLHRSTDANHTIIEDNMRATARVLVNALNYVGLKTLTQNKHAFIKLDDKAISDDLIHCISPQHFILEILESSKISSDFVERLSELHKKGYRFALNHYKISDDFMLHFKAVLPFISYIKIDIRHSARENIATVLAQLSSLDAKFIAEKVEDEEDYLWAKEIGFDYFEGYYFSKPQIYIKEMVDPESDTLLKLIYLLKTEASLEEVILIFNNSPYLSVNLLKFIHLHQNKDDESISSIDQALILLGRDKLSYWVELMIYAQGSDNDEENISSPLGKIARQRAALMEELAHTISQGKELNLATSAYLVGILSLAEAMFQSSFKHLFEQMDINQHISNALLNKEGVLGELLQLCIAVEKNDFEAIDKFLHHFNLSQAQLNHAMLFAYKRTSACEG